MTLDKADKRQAEAIFREVELPKRETNTPRLALAYPDMCRFRHDPDKAPCRGLGYCPRDISCSE